MTKLTDTQLIVLSKAVQRDDGAAVIPQGMKGAAAAKVATSLIARKLMREICQKPGMPVWRKDADDRCFSLVLLRAGREAIGAEDNEQVDAPASKLAAIRAPAKATTTKRQQAAGQEQAAKSAPRAGSKQATIIEMLADAKGATLDALIDATDWLPHTMRAALTGLRKRGFQIDRSRDDKRGSVYRIISLTTA